MSEKRCFLVGAGAHYETDRIKNMLQKNSDDLHDNDCIIAVDGGFDYLIAQGITPDLIIGDLDSTDLSDHSIKDSDIPTIKFPPEKDYSDMFLAAKEGFKKGYNTFYIFGGMGKRFDHTMANIQLLSYIAENGGRGYMYGDGCVLTAITDGSINIAEKKGYISVFSLSDVSEGVTISGLKYSADDITLKRNESIGLSNEFEISDSNDAGKNGCTITVKRGSLLIITQNS